MLKKVLLAVIILPVHTGHSENSTYDRWCVNRSKNLLVSKEVNCDDVVLSMYSQSSVNARIWS